MISHLDPFPLRLVQSLRCLGLVIFSAFRLAVAELIRVNELGTIITYIELCLNGEVRYVPNNSNNSVCNIVKNLRRIAQLFIPKSRVLEKNGQRLLLVVKSSIVACKKLSYPHTALNNIGK